MLDVFLCGSGFLFGTSTVVGSIILLEILILNCRGNEEIEVMMDPVDLSETMRREERKD